MFKRCRGASTRKSAMTRMTSQAVLAAPPQLWIHLPEQIRRRLAAQIARALRQALHDRRAGDGDADIPSVG
jgi:hypothetical protein